MNWPICCYCSILANLWSRLIAHPVSLQANWTKNQFQKYLLIEAGTKEDPDPRFDCQPYKLHTGQSMLWRFRYTGCSSLILYNVHFLPLRLIYGRYTNFFLGRSSPWTTTRRLTDTSEDGGCKIIHAPQTVESYIWGARNKEDREKTVS